jgi:Protein of unknown function (DUF3866)
VIHLRRAEVRLVTGARAGASELVVLVDGKQEPALAYPELVGPVEVGDVVIVNTTAVDLGLGTGGLHLVVAVEGRDVVVGGGGHVMKARYLPHQVAVASVEETHQDLLETSNGLRQTPVVCAPLHSMVAAVAAGAKRSGAGCRVVYVMTDGAALAGGFSELVPRLLDAALLDGWITCGQAVGGHLEAVTVWTAMLAATEILEADVIVIADGPGNLGTDTTWGVSALGSGNALNAAYTLGGRPIPALRVSFADERVRHRGLSHHSVTILRDVCKVETNVPVPSLADEEQRAAIWEALRAAKLEETHHLVEVDGQPAVSELGDRGVAASSMGRAIEDDPPFWLAAGAAGVLAGRLAVENRRWRPMNV